MTINVCEHMFEKESPNPLRKGFTPKHHLPVDFNSQLQSTTSWSIAKNLVQNTWELSFANKESTEKKEVSSLQDVVDSINAREGPDFLVIAHKGDCPSE